jgi:deoxyhypusine synthase
MCGMSRKSRFLRVPVEPFQVEPGLSGDDVLARMERVSFQGRNLATARRIWEKMLGADCTIFLGMAGALSAGGMRGRGPPHHTPLRRLSRVDRCEPTTTCTRRGAAATVGSPREDDAALQADHIDRVYDTYASEDEFIDNDEWIAAFVLTLERRVHFP